MFIMIDGIDGSGKSTIIETWKNFLRENGNGFLDLVEYWKMRDSYPEKNEIRPYEFIISGEPTYTGVGKVLRQELIKNGNNYTPQAIAEAFSLDRAVLYEKVIIPALKDKKFIIQDRGISSTLAYQPIQTKQITTKYLANLSGNKLALKYRPDYLFIMNTKPEEAIKRIKNRADKQDNAIFEKLKFLKKLDKKFRSTEYQKIFKKAGTKIIYLEGNQKIDIMKAQALKSLVEIINKS